MAKLEEFAAILRDEAERQSLIARSTFDTMWVRHILDSAQLVSIVDQAEGHWVDVGTGGGPPGMIVAILRDQPITMIEPRRKRAEFLFQCVSHLNLAHAAVIAGRVENVRDQAAFISARAVSSVGEFLRMTSGIVSRGTTFLLPRGESGLGEVAGLMKEWHGVFHVKHSLSDPRSAIIIANDVRPR